MTEEKCAAATVGILVGRGCPACEDGCADFSFRRAGGGGLNKRGGSKGASSRVTQLRQE